MCVSMLLVGQRLLDDADKLEIRIRKGALG